MDKQLFNYLQTSNAEELFLASSVLCTFKIATSVSKIFQKSLLDCSLIREVSTV